MRETEIREIKLFDLEHLLRKLAFVHSEMIRDYAVISKKIVTADV